MKTLSKFLFLFLILSTLSACKKDDETADPDLVAGFEATTHGLGVDDTSLKVKIDLSRKATVAAEITIALTEGGTVYGTDYNTTPAANNTKLILPIAVGTDFVEFQLDKLQSPAFGESKTITFAITAVSEAGKVGTNNQTVITFSENPVSAGADLEPTVGGATQPNQVYLDLSKQSEVIKGRGDWDFEFYSGEDFIVRINSSAFMLARPLADKTDLAAITSEDTVGFSALMTVPSFEVGVYEWVDSPDGDLTKTAIAEISATDDENNVYIINRGTAPDGTARGWKKIRILRDGAGYKIQHADIAATTFEETKISKDSDFNFTFMHLDNGVVDIEPKKDSWDICFTNHTKTLNFGHVIPYGFKDIVLQNRNGVETAMIMIEGNTTYESFSKADLSGVEYNTALDAIGSNWRHTAPPNPADINTDRFFIVKDGDGNIYKLKFTQLVDAQTEERGFPKITYQLL